MSLEDMVVDLVEHLAETDGRDYTAWEVDFVEAMEGGVLDEKSFTEAMATKIEELFEKHLG